MEPQVYQYIDILRANASKTSDFHQFGIVEGRKYYKVIQGYGLEPIEKLSGKSVHSFIDKETLDLFKPASWAAPAKGARFNLREDMDTLTDVVDPYGSYLYRNR